MDPALRSAWRRLQRVWKPMAAWSLLVWGLLAAVLTPLSTALVRWVWHRGEAAVVANEALVAWVFTPQGLTWLLAAGSLGLMGAALHYAGFFELVTADLEGRTVSLAELGLRLPRRLPSILRMCAAVTAGALLLVLPLAGGLYGIREVVLGARDINYYLYERPPTWWFAVAAAGGWLLLWGAAAAYLAARSLLALPAYLDGHRPMLAALQSSWRQTRERGARIARLILATAFVWVAVRVAVDTAVVAATSRVVDATAAASASLYPVVVATGASFLVALAVDVSVAFLGTAFLAILLTKLYYEDTDLHSAAVGDAAGVRLQDDVGGWAGRWFRPWRAMVFAGLVMAGSAAVGAVILQRLPEPRPVSVTAHRAGPPPSPENTLAALERSVAAGADWAEVDVQLSGDGEPVVVHDVDLMRVAGDPRRVAETEYSELRDLVQRPDDGSPPAERRVATLREFLERARGRIGLNIELKYYGRDPRLASEVVRTIREAGMVDEVMVMSLDMSGVRQVDRAAPEIKTGYAAALAAGDLTRLPVEFLAVSRSRVTGRLVRGARRRNVDVHVWTLNSASAMVEAIQRGADGIITDRPRLAVRVREELNDMPAVGRLLLRFGSLAIEEEDAASVTPGERGSE